MSGIGAGAGAGERAIPAGAGAGAGSYPAWPSIPKRAPAGAGAGVGSYPAGAGAGVGSYPAGAGAGVGSYPAGAGAGSYPAAAATAAVNSVAATTAGTAGSKRKKPLSNNTRAASSANVASAAGEGPAAKRHAGVIAPLVGALSKKENTNQSAKINSDIEGAGIVVIHIDQAGYNWALLGKESSWCDNIATTLVDPRTKGGVFKSTADFKTYEDFIPPANAADIESLVHSEFSARAGALSAANNRIIKYDTPIKSKARPGLWRVKFRYLPKEFKYGIVKGQRKEDETIVENLLREFEEEVGIDIPANTRMGSLDKLVETYRMFFTYTADIASAKGMPSKALVATIQNKIKENDAAYYGELYDLQFMSVDTIFGDSEIYNRLNVKSRKTLELLYPAQSGKRRNNNMEAAAALMGAGPHWGGSRRRRVGRAKRKTHKRRKI